MPANVVPDVGVARDAGYDPKWYLFNGRNDHTYTHRLGPAMVKVWLWGGMDRPASPDRLGGGSGTLYRVQMNRGDKLRIRVGGRPTKSGGGSTDGTWGEWLDGKLIRGGWPDGGEGVKQELTVVWGRANDDTGPDRTRKIQWRCNGAGGSTRVWLTPLGENERLIIVEPGMGASADPRYANGGGSPMDEFPGSMSPPFVGPFPYDRETWRPPGPLDDDPTFQEWPPGGGTDFRYQYGWAGMVSNFGVWPDNNYGEPPPYDGGSEYWYPFPAPEGYTPAWFSWEQDMPASGVTIFGRSIYNPSWPVTDIDSPGSWTNDTRDEAGYRIGDNFHDEGVGVPPGPDEEPRAPRPPVPPKASPSDISPPSSEQRETRFGEAGWESRGGNGEASAFGPRCPGGGGWGGGSAGNATRRMVEDGWVSWIRMGQGTGKNGGRWWNTEHVETVIGVEDDGRGNLWGVPEDEPLNRWRYNTFPFWVPSYPGPPAEPPDGRDYCWPESVGGYVYVVEEGDDWGSWVRVGAGGDGPFPYFNNPDYDGYTGMGAAWICAEKPGTASRARWRIGRLGWGRTRPW